MWLHRAIRKPARRWQHMVGQILDRESQLTGLTDHDLKTQSLAIRYRARTGEPLADLLTEAFALVREASHRKLQMRHYPVQLLGGTALHHGTIAEMQTGEGKTLTAALPLYLQALSGRGAHLATANDYLAQRDADWLRPVYELLGLSVGVIQSQQTRVLRQEAYACDITYGTAKEFGFDFLKDRLLERRLSDGDRDVLGPMLGQESAMTGGDKPLQRPLNFALVDEADSVLIDDARTPLILSAIPSKNRLAAETAFRWAAEHAAQFQKEDHFTLSEKSQAVEMTANGRRFVRRLAKPEAMGSLGQRELYEYTERAIKVLRDYHRDQQYIVQNQEIVIVDESTGRLAVGRKWRDGVHQAVEAKEHLPISFATTNAAQITVQQFFRLYANLSGMTGTAQTAAVELRKIYELPVVVIPTHRKSQRNVLPDRVFPTADEKWHAVAEEARERQLCGQPVLIGTRSIEKSDVFAEYLKKAGVEFVTLHAKHSAAEAEIVSQAGQLGRVTIATNMAGRGTDIELGPGVAELGGLHVICTELHDSARIDRQLIGRCARQGDLGSCVRFLSGEDDVLKNQREESPFPAKPRQGIAVLENAQRKTEAKQTRNRRLLLHYVKRRTELQKRMGLNPYLDTPG